MDTTYVAGAGEEFKFDTDIFMTRYSPSSMLSATLQEDSDDPVIVKTEPGSSTPESSPRVKAEPGLPVVKVESMSSDELAQHYLQSALLTFLLAQSLPMTLPPSSSPTSPVVPDQQAVSQSKKVKEEEKDTPPPPPPAHTKTEKPQEMSRVRRGRPPKRKTPERPDLICPTCNSGPFSKPFTLKRHITKRHEGLRPYKCNQPGCNMAFGENATLKRHMMTHTGERPYNCDWPGCTKTFADRTNIKRHKVVHEGKLPFRCPDPKCVRGYATDEELQAHMSKYEHGLA